MSSTIPSESTGPTSGTDPSDPPGVPGRRRPGAITVLVAVLVAGVAALTVLALAARSADGDGADAISVDEALGNVDVSRPVPEGTQPVGVGDRAPDVQLAYLDGGVQRLSELRGGPVVLNFWSSTCAPCLKEMPAFQDVSERFDGRVTFVGVDVTDTEQAGREMVRRTGVEYRNARDPRSEILAAFGGTVLPRTVLLDAAGTVVATHSGELDREDLTGLLRENGLVERG